MRLFVAIELSNEVKSALTNVQRSLSAWSKAVRWTPAAQLHLTAKFLGEVAEESVSAIREAVVKVADSAQEFDLTLTGTGCFPPGGAVRIVWVGAADVPVRLSKLVEGLENEFEPMGFSRESRPFSPHLTIGRVQEDSSGGRLRSAVVEAKVRSVTQRVAALTLMSSVLSPKGPSYSVVARAALGTVEM